MVGYVGVDEQIDKDFHQARRRAFLQRLGRRLRGDASRQHLLSFDEAKGALARWSQTYRGMRTVDVEKITGSVGRCKDFDDAFLPLKFNMARRWERVDRAYQQGIGLPAVSLYKIGEAYLPRPGEDLHRAARRERGPLLQKVDDGVGIPAGRSAGVGLSSMRERASELGGSSVVEKATKGGTRVLVRLPLPEE